MGNTRRWVAFSLVVVGAWMSPACGGESEADGDDGGSGGKVLDGGNDSTSGGSSGTGATGGASGGGGSGGGGACDPADCPGFGSFVQGCCLPDDSCGYDGSPLGLGCVSQEDIGSLLDGGFETSVPDGAADPGCEDFQIAGFNLEGCCLDTGFCGLYVPILLNQCVDPQSLPAQIPKPDTGPPKPCGDGGVIVTEGAPPDAPLATDADTGG
jgi:hypothetical protein